ncbi:MAG: protein kinase domain-containing protein [Gemmatimonadales bacterium]
MTAPIDRLRSALGDRYILERQAGEGGMATVFLARDLKHERSVAIKVLRPELSASLGGDRFLREIRVAATLQHPNILGLYDSGETEGLLYYVMPFVEGESLRHRLDREQQLPLHDALRITREAAEALQYAHERGIVHRDIKPENILLLGGHALVADFGIARAVSEAGGEKLTQTGMAIGTPYYMSPEQSLGSDRVDARSDVYSLGCVLYELLIGQPPFTGPNAMAIMARHSMERVPSLQVVRSSIPDEVEDIVLRALEKTPADRFQTMQEMVEALSEAEADVTMQRTAARRAATASRRVPTGTVVTPILQPPKPNRKAAWIAGGAVVVLLAAAGGWMLWRQRGAVSAAAAKASADGFDPHRIAVRYFESPTGSDSLAYVASGLTEGLIGQLDEVPGLSVISSNGVAAFRSDSIPPDSVARTLKVGTLVEGSVEQNAGRLRVTVRLVDGGSGVDFQRASFEQPAGNLLAVRDTLAQRVAGLIRVRLGQEIRIREQRAGTTSPEAWVLVQRAEAAGKQAEALVAKGDTTGAVAHAYDMSDSIYARAQAIDPKWAEPLVGRAVIGYRRSRLAVDDPLAAKPWIVKGESFADSALARDPQNPDALEARGTLRYWSWLLALEPEPAAAKELLKNAQTDLESSVRIRPAQAGAWAVLSHLYNQTGGETDAALAARRAYEEDAYLSNADQVLSRLFLASYDLGQFTDASRWCQEGQRRFPNDFKFVSCQLWLMTSRAKEPDVTLAWVLADSLAKLAPAGGRQFEKLKARMAVAAVLARKGLADSARHVAEGSRGNPDVDPTRDLLYIEAFVRMLLNDKAEALKALKVYLAVNPDRRATLSDDPGWWFRGLQDDSAFQTLVRGR